jgi:branched-chain amino acid transport system substrate-binding protein
LRCKGRRLLLARFPAPAYKRFDGFGLADAGRQGENGLQRRASPRLSALLSLLAAGLLAMGVAAIPAHAQTRKVGLSLPLAGDASLLGKQFLEGARLALEREGAGSGIEIVAADDGCDREIGELASADLRSAGVELVTGLLCQDAAISAADIFRASAIPVIMAGAGSSRLPRDRAREGWNLWRMAPGDEYPAQAAFRVLSQRWQGKPWAIVDDGSAYGRTLADDLRARMEEAGQPPQLADNFRPAQSTQASLVRRLQGSGVRKVFIAASAEDVAQIAAEALAADPAFEIAGGDALELLPFTEAAARAPDGLLAFLAPHPSGLAAVRDLDTVLAQRGIEPERYVYVGYAAMQLVLEAIGENPAATTQALGAQAFPTILGEVRFDAEGRNVLNPYVLHEWRGGAFRPLEGPPQ